MSVPRTSSAHQSSNASDSVGARRASSSVISGKAPSPSVRTTRVQSVVSQRAPSVQLVRLFETPLTLVKPQPALSEWGHSSHPRSAVTEKIHVPRFSAGVHGPGTHRQA